MGAPPATACGRRGDGSRCPARTPGRRSRPTPRGTPPGRRPALPPHGAAGQRPLRTDEPWAGSRAASWPPPSPARPPGTGEGPPTGAAAGGRAALLRSTAHGSARRPSRSTGRRSSPPRRWRWPRGRPAGSAGRPPSSSGPRPTSSPLGERDAVVGLDGVAPLERPHHPELRQVHPVVRGLRNVGGRARDRGEDGVPERGEPPVATGEGRHLRGDDVPDLQGPGAVPDLVGDGGATDVEHL